MNMRAKKAIWSGFIVLMVLTAIVEALDDRPGSQHDYGVNYDSEYSQNLKEEYVRTYGGSTAGQRELIADIFGQPHRRVFFYEYGQLKPYGLVTTTGQGDVSDVGDLYNGQIPRYGLPSWVPPGK